jgi:predicted outer membrane protein
MTMRNLTGRAALALLLCAPFAAPAVSQGTLGQEVAPNQTEGYTGKTRPEQWRNEAPAQAVETLQEYANALGEARSRLEAAIGRSGGETPANQQSAVTPAWMDLKAAAQNALQTVRRAPSAFRGETAYTEVETQVRQELNQIDQATEPKDITTPARNMLSQVQRLQQEVGRRTSG